MIKALKYMVVGATVATAVMMYKTKDSFSKTMKRMKRTGMEKINQFKEMF